MNQKKSHSPLECPVAEVTKIIADHCTMLILRDLLKGPKRFKELEYSLKGISTRTLTLKLKLLEERSLISRKKFHERPPRVEYSLTPQGKKLSGIFKAIKVFGEKYL
jgi:DNA-binding HxlR family transcriptional regulator